MARSGGEFGSGQGDGRPQKKTVEPKRPIPLGKKETTEKEPERIFGKFGQDDRNKKEPHDPDNKLITEGDLIDISPYEIKRGEEPTIIQRKIFRLTDEETIREQTVGITLGELRTREVEEESNDLPDIENLTREEFWRTIADRLAPLKAHDYIRKNIQGFPEDGLAFLEAIPRQTLDQEIQSRFLIEPEADTPRRMDFTPSAGDELEFTLGFNTSNESVVTPPPDADVTADDVFGPEYWKKADRRSPLLGDRIFEQRDTDTERRTEPPEDVTSRIIRDILRPQPPHSNEEE